jgi:hypothetical protein
MHAKGDPRRLVAQEVTGVSARVLAQVVLVVLLGAVRRRSRLYARPQQALCSS